MQYALMGGGASAELLVDAAEYVAFMSWGKERGSAHSDDWIVDVDTPESEFTLKLLYGAYMAQPGVSLAQAAIDANARLGAQFGTIRNRECFPMELCDLAHGAPFQSGRCAWIPVAALVASKVAMPKGKRAMTAFVRYGNVSAMDNIINRPGLFAFRAQEKRSVKGLSRENWRAAIDFERMQRIGTKPECARHCGCGSSH